MPRWPRAWIAAAACFTMSVIASVAGAQAPPTNLQASDHDWDGGDHIDLKWELSSDDATLTAYQVLQATATIGGISIEPQFTHIEYVARGTNEFTVADVRHELDQWDVRKQFEGRIDIDALLASGEGPYPIGYLYRVVAVGEGGAQSPPAQTQEPITPSIEIFDGGRLWLAIITIIVCGSVVMFIYLARSGMNLKVRRIAGLEAVDEAVGRATEMGRPVLFVAGTQDMNDIQTIAGLTVLSRVAKTAAEYDAKVEVPTSRSLVMTAARETVHASFLTAGRPDAFNPDMIYYVTDEQFGFVAHLQGTMVRQKPAACFYMGHFFAESLILAETGNNIGAIQLAGTAAPAQLPFFVAACDYTLIGEEFFAASAYLSGEPDQLGSLKGQDVGKLVVAIFLIIGCLIATAAAITNHPALVETLEFIRSTMLT